MLPVNVPPQLRTTAALFIAHAGYALIHGGFEIDMRDGEVAFKTSLRLSSDELSDQMLTDLIGANLRTFDRMLPGFMALIHGKRSLRYALKIVGQPLEEPPAQNSGAQAESGGEDETA